MTETIMIGCFSEFCKGNYPSIKDCIHEGASDNKGAILSYLKKGRIVAAAPASVRDVMTGEDIHMELTAMTDGEYEWRSDLIYYYDRYNVELPEAFVEKVLRQGR